MTENTLKEHGLRKKPFKRGKLIECMARFLRDNGSSTSHQIFEGMAFKNGKKIKNTLYGVSLCYLVRMLRMYHFFKEIEEIPNSYKYELAVSYERVFNELETSLGHMETRTSGGGWNKQ